MIWKGYQWSEECKKVKGEPRVWLDRGYLKGSNDESRFKIGPLFRKLQTNIFYYWWFAYSLARSLAHLLPHTTYWDPCNFLNNSLIFNFFILLESSQSPLSKSIAFTSLWPFCTLMENFNDLEGVLMVWRVQKGQREAKGLIGQWRLRGFKWWKQIKNRTVIQEVTKKYILLLVAR